MKSSGTAMRYSRATLRGVARETTMRVGKQSKNGSPQYIICKLPTHLKCLKLPYACSEITRPSLFLRGSGHARLTSTRISLHDVETWKRETVILSYINIDFVIVYKPTFNLVDPYNHVTTLKPSLYLS